MSNHYMIATRALGECRHSARQGKKGLATLLLWFAEEHLKQEPSPLRYLELTLEVDRVVREHFLPESGL